MADVHGAGGVGGDILDVDASAGAGGGVAVGFSSGEDGGDDGSEDRGVEAEVDEAGTGWSARKASATAAASLAGGWRAALAMTMAALVAMSPCAGSRVGVTSTRERTSSGRPGTVAFTAARTVWRMVA
jgi:hypothetical protein